MINIQNIFKSEHEAAFRANATFTNIPTAGVLPEEGPESDMTRRYARLKLGRNWRLHSRIRGVRTSGIL